MPAAPSVASSMNGSTVSSLNGGTHPPWSNPPLRSSSGDNGDWMTPSRLTRTIHLGVKKRLNDTLNAIYCHPQVDNGAAQQVKGRVRDKWRDFG